MRVYQTTSQQTVFDAALVVYGSLDDGLKMLLEDNPEIVLEDGSVAQFGAMYRTRKDVVDERVVRRLSGVPVATGASGGSSGAWVSPQLVPWTTAQDQVWQLPSSVPGGGAGVRPDNFSEEINPGDDNFEVYSQYGGVNKKTKLSKTGPRIVSVNYIPQSTGNTQHLNAVLTDPNGDVWFVSGAGVGVKLNGGGTAQVVEWHVEEVWVSGVNVAFTFNLPPSATDLKEKVMVFRSGVKMRYASDWTRAASGQMTLAIPAQNEPIEIYIHKSLI